MVVEDELLGVFALHDEFDLLLKEESSEWRARSASMNYDALLQHQKRIAKSDHQTSNVQPTAQDSTKGLMQLPEIVQNRFEWARSLVWTRIYNEWKGRCIECRPTLPVPF
jgi:hypothetical protein